MASTPARPRTRLYLAIPETIDAKAMDALASSLAENEVAAVLLRLPPSDPRTQTDRIKSFAPAVQASGAALLIDGHADLVARGGADGAHLTGIPQMLEARPSLQPQRIAGVGGLQTRHDAMLAGEAGVDYVLFGEPARDGTRPALDAIAERVSWWAEVFEVPCVGYSKTPEEAKLLASAGADFVLVEDCVWHHPESATTGLMDAARAIGQSQPRFTNADSR